MFQSSMADAYISFCIQTECSQCKCLPPAATLDLDPMQIDTTYEWTWSKSFCIIDKTIFQLGMMLAIFGMCLW